MSAIRIGVGGPVGSGKTALVNLLCRHLRSSVDLAVITNDIYTREDADFLVKAAALPVERIEAVETGACPHSAVRDDISINMNAVEPLEARFPGLELIVIESGGDNLAATFSPDLVDYTIYVIDVAGGEKIPRKGGPAQTFSDLLLINKIDLAEAVGASLDVMRREAGQLRSGRPTVMTDMRHGVGVDEVLDWVRCQLAAGHRGQAAFWGAHEHHHH